jgi:hypothetical protein
MCIPAVMNLVKGVGQAVGLMPQDAPAAPAAPDPAAERAKAEADAANTANANVAADKRARRANTLALGGQSDNLGATQSAVTNVAKTSVLGGGAS